MGNDILRQHFNYLVKYTEELQLQKYYFNRCKNRYEEIYQYCCKNGYDAFTYLARDDYLNDFSKNKGQSIELLRKKIAYTAATYFETGEFKWKKIRLSNYPLSMNNTRLLDALTQKMSQNLCLSTVKAGACIVRKFLHEYELGSKAGLEEITNEDILNFIRKEAPNHKQSLSRLIRTMRKFVCFLKEEGIANLTEGHLLVNPGRCQTKVLPCFTENEVCAIFSQIDCSTDKGRRDYAIFLLALRTGLRAVDIAMLKLSEIDWERNRITITQKKTQVEIELPLPIDVGNAIADYILNSRYKSNSPYIFLRLRKSNSNAPLSADLFNELLKKYMKTAELGKFSGDGKTFHAFRRTAGTQMLKSNTPVHTVSQILGHRNLESTKRYLMLDSKNLVECCLNLGSLSTRKEGLI